MTRDRADDAQARAWSRATRERAERGEVRNDGLSLRARLDAERRKALAAEREAKR